MKLEIYTDGACSGNQFKENKGGWAYIIIEDGQKKYYNSGKHINTTNNKMELIAFLKAFQFLHTIKKNGDINKYNKIIIYSDSAYIINCFIQKWYEKWRSNGWKTSKGKLVKNQILWKEILSIYIEIQENISLKHIKGHSGNKWNDFVDNIAVKTMQS